MSFSSFGSSSSGTIACLAAFQGMLDSGLKQHTVLDTPNCLIALFGIEAGKVSRIYITHRVWNDMSHHKVLIQAPSFGDWAPALRIAWIAVPTWRVRCMR